MPAANESGGQGRERLRRRKEQMGEEEREKGLRRREQMEKEERDRGRERVRRRESSSYYMWRSLPGAYDKSLLALPGIEIPQRTPQLLSQWEGHLPPLVDYPSLLKDLYTGSNTAESIATSRTTSGSTTVSSLN